VSLKTLFSITLFALSSSLFIFQSANAGPLRDLVSSFRADKASSKKPALPFGVRAIQNIAYGKDEKQRIDVYLPPHANNAPIIFMVHGGAWITGDKANKTVVENKVKRWVKRGIILVSANYRLVPNVDPLTQVNDIKKALLLVQKKAKEWAGDSEKIVLMGHSAGAHLVSVLANLPNDAFGFKVKPWLGVVEMDTGSLNVVKKMNGKHQRFHDKIFGKSQAYWKSVSPYHLLNRKSAPILAICSTQHDKSCQQATEYLKKAASFGTRTKKVTVDLSHKGVNEELGKPSSYTRQVDRFLFSLDNAFKPAQKLSL